MLCTLELCEREGVCVFWHWVGDVKLIHRSPSVELDSVALIPELLAASASELRC